MVLHAEVPKIFFLTPRKKIDILSGPIQTPLKSTFYKSKNPEFSSFRKLHLCKSLQLTHSRLQTDYGYSTYLVPD